MQERTRWPSTCTDRIIALRGTSSHGLLTTLTKLGEPQPMSQAWNKVLFVAGKKSVKIGVGQNK